MISIPLGGVVVLRSKKMDYIERDYKCSSCGIITQMKTNHPTPTRCCNVCRVYGAYRVQQTDEGIKIYEDMIAKKEALRARFPKSIPTTKKQEVVFTKQVKIRGEIQDIQLAIDWDDTCNNGHNSFGVVISTNDEWGREHLIQYFPEYEHLLKYHLLSSDGYMHISNIAYMLDNPKEYTLEDARSYAIWEDATEEQLRDNEALINHLATVVLPQLKLEIEKLGMVY